MRGPRYKSYLLGLLTVILLFNYVDRIALGVVLQDIKAELDLTDTQLGLLSGIAFAFFYSVMGIPIARWADRGNRVTIIWLTTALWSGAVALCGMAGSFLQLLAIRIGVAVGEAGCVPPAYSLMADYFNRAERPRAAAIYGSGGALSGVVGYFLAGWLNALYGWRATFMLLGVPGLVLAVLAWLTLREPQRTVPASEQPSLRTVCAALWANATFRHLLLALSVLFFFNYGIVLWQPTFFIRSFGLSSSEIGTWLAVAIGIGSTAGSYLGGVLASRLAPNDERLQLKGAALTIATAAIPMILACLSSDPYWAFLLVGLYFFVLTLVNGPLFATIQTLVPERMRAMSFALIYLFANLIGMGLGPLATGALSDALHPRAAEESLRYALLILAPGFLLSGWYVWRASKTAARDLAATPSNPHDALS